MSIDLNMSLSDHFVLHEFVISQTAERKRIDNTPSAEVVERLRTLCRDILEPARVALGPLRISSGYRCDALNKAVKGSKTSAHCFGYAADVIPIKATRKQFAKWVRDNCDYDQIILEFGTPQEPAWIHVSCDPRGRSEVLRTNGKGYVNVNL